MSGRIQVMAPQETKNFEETSDLRALLREAHTKSEALEARITKAREYIAQIRSDSFTLTSAEAGMAEMIETYLRGE